MVQCHEHVVYNDDFLVAETYLEPTNDVADIPDQIFPSKITKSCRCGNSCFRVRRRAILPETISHSTVELSVGLAK